MKISTTITAAGIALLCNMSAHAVIISTQTAHPYNCENCERLSHDTLTTHWPAGVKKLGHDTLHQQMSKKYAIKTKFKNLEKGVDLYTEAPGAVIRISAPLATNSLKAASSFKPTFYIKTKKSGLLQLNEAANLVATNDELNDSYFAKNTPAILQLKPELGAGKITILANKAPGHEEDPYIVHVFDKNAQSVLTVATNKAMYQLGDQLTTTITLGDDISNYPLDLVTATLVSPTGETTTLPLKQNNDDSYTATTVLNSEKNIAGDHWYVIAETTTSVEDGFLNRQAQTAFTYAIPSAVIKEINQIEKTPFTFKANLDVATASRYALQTILFKSDAQGNKIPLEVVQSAAWLTPGNNEINFSFSPVVRNSDAEKFYIGAVQLIDYGQIKPVFSYDGFIPIKGSPD